MQSSVPAAFPPQVFNEIRNEHFSNVFGFLSQKARNLQAQYDVRLPPGASVYSLCGSPGCCLPDAAAAGGGTCGRAVVTPV